MTQFPHLEREWTALALAARNVFGTAEFAETWWQCYGAGAEDRVELVDGILVPLVVERRGPLRVARFLGHGPGDELGPVCAPECRPEAAASLRTVLERGGWDVFAGELLPRDPAWAALGGRPASVAGSPVIRFPSEDWDEYLRTRSSNFRQLVRRRSRKVEQRGGVFRLADGESLERDLDALFALHRERWSGGTDFDRAEPFHRAFARVALERDWLRLWTLEIDGEAAASWYGFRFAGVESYYQAGRARRFDDLAVGLVLLAHTIRAAQADGVAEYRFLRGDEPYKYRFTGDDPGLVTIVRSRGALGRVALGAVLAARRARQVSGRIASRSALRSSGESPTTQTAPTP
jgi:CelD/BcsL family acetyltransferase involved in cellulose biosynthesis